MDAATAQTGLTIWQAIILASIPGILTAILGSHLNLKNSIKISEKRFKSDLEIKREEIKIYKERVFVEKKIGILGDVEALLDRYDSFFIEDTESFRSKLLSVRDRIDSYIIIDGLFEIAQRGVNEVEYIFELREDLKKAEKMKKEERDSLFENIKSRMKKPASALRITLLMLQQHLSFDLGFRPKKAFGGSKDIDTFADASVNMIFNIKNDL